MNDQNTNQKPKGFIERFQTLIAIIFIPLGIGIAGLMLDNTKVEQEYLKISLSIIQDKISKELAEDLKNGLDFNISKPIEVINKSVSPCDSSEYTNYASEGVWFTIVGSLPISVGEKKAESVARNIFKKMSDKDKDYSIQLYQTTLSNRYAITLNGEQDKSDAIKLAREVREYEIEKTSFAQINKNWRLIEDYNFK